MDIDTLNNLLTFGFYPMIVGYWVGKEYLGPFILKKMKEYDFRRYFNKKEQEFLLGKYIKEEKQ
jgi:hypothetical protein